ncbi:MAG: Methylthioribose kinase [Candidatus Erwinia impunctatus]|nr:Methylthioribose kinase [Culicoides impunctatus]
MSDYQIFTAREAVAFARQHGQHPQPSSLVDAEEIGDGNLNLVFKIKDDRGVSQLVVKQALPYVRCVGESWPLTLDRARIEAEVSGIHSQFCPEHAVKILHYDSQHAAMVMEDLSVMAIWRGELVKGHYYPHAASQLGRYLATTLFYTSDFYQHPHQKKQQVIRFTNPELCHITEELFFNEPYEVHARNSYPTELEPLVAALRNEQPLRLQVAGLKHRFLSHAEALLHGDVHSGSLFVSADNLKVIDAEFGFYGPVGFDVGNALGNLLLNYCALSGLMTTTEARLTAQHQRLDEVRNLWSAFASHFLTLVNTQSQDRALALSGYGELFLRKIWQDTLGFCGTEMIRRTVGMSPVADMLSINDTSLRHTALRKAILLGRLLILHADTISDTDALITHIIGAD